MYTKLSTERPSDIAMRENKEKKKPKPRLSSVFQKKNNKKLKTKMKKKSNYWFKKWRV